MLTLHTVLQLAQQAGIRMVVDHDKSFDYCPNIVYGEDLINFARVVQNYLEQNVST